VLQPRAMYPPFSLPMPNATTLWHHTQPPFHATNMAAFNPFFEVSPELFGSRMAKKKHLFHCH
jgi:hypothetical protein